MKSTRYILEESLERIRCVLVDPLNPQFPYAPPPPAPAPRVPAPMDLGTFATACNAQKVCDMLNQRIELLAALESLTDAASKQLPQGADHDGLTNCDLLAKAREAIAKAKGGE